MSAASYRLPTALEPGRARWAGSGVSARRFAYVKSATWLSPLSTAGVRLHRRMNMLVSREVCSKEPGERTAAKSSGHSIKNASRGTENQRIFETAQQAYTD